MDLIVISACMQMEIKQKIENGKIKAHTHIKNKIYSRKPFRQKTQLEGEVTSLSFFVWKYGCRYKAVMPVARGLLQCTDPLCVLYLLSLLSIFSHLWNKILSKEWNASSFYWPDYNTTQ